MGAGRAIERTGGPMRRERREESLTRETAVARATCVIIGHVEIVENSNRNPETIDCVNEGGECEAGDDISVISLFKI